MSGSFRLCCLFVSGLWLLGLVACVANETGPATPAGGSASPSPSVALLPVPSWKPASTSTPTFTLTKAPTSASPSPTVTSTTTPDTRPLPRNWRAWPVLPTVSPRAVEIYRRGRELGVIPYTFSVVGDCQSEPQVFLGIYATNRNPIGPDHPELQETIRLFYNSFWHDSVAVRDGLSAPSVLNPLWNDPQRCQADESPLACELRTYRPMIVFVNLGTNWRPDVSVSVYEKYLREIVDEIIASGAVPILTNKADNVEGDYAINRVTAQVAYDYDIPHLNFWRAVQPLENHGLDPNRHPPNVYLTPQAWDVRNWVALQALDLVWRGVVSGQP